MAVTEKMVNRNDAEMITPMVFRSTSKSVISTGTA